MDYDVKKLIITLVIIIVIISIVYVSYRLIMNTPLGRGLNKFLDGVSGILAGIGAQLETCNKVGYFNVGKGCWTGVLALGIGILFGGAWLYSKFKTTSGNDSIDRTAQMRETSADQVVQDVISRLDLNKVNQLGDNPADNAALQKSLTRASFSEELKAINNSPNNPAARAAAKTAAKLRYDAKIDEINKGLSDNDEIEESDTTANDIVDPPVFE